MQGCRLPSKLPTRPSIAAHNSKTLSPEHSTKTLSAKTLSTEILSAEYSTEILSPENSAHNAISNSITEPPPSVHKKDFTVVTTNIKRKLDSAASAQPSLRTAKPAARPISKLRAPLKPPQTTTKPQTSTKEQLKPQTTVSAEEHTRKKRAAWDIKGRLCDLEQIHNSSKSKLTEQSSLINLHETESRLASVELTAQISKTLALETENARLSLEHRQLLQQLERERMDSTAKYAKLAGDCEVELIASRCKITSLQFANTEAGNRIVQLAAQVTSMQVTLS